MKSITHTPYIVFTKLFSTYSAHLPPVHTLVYYIVLSLIMIWKLLVSISAYALDRNLIIFWSPATEGSYQRPKIIDGRVATPTSGRGTMLRRTPR